MRPTDPGSFWLDRDDGPVRPSFVGEADVDVAIVGGGIAGATLARALTRTGRRVVVLEGHRVGRGASGRNAGFLLAEAAETFAELARTLGLPAARAARGAGLATRAAVREIAAEALARDGAGIDLRWTGSLRLAGDDGELADFEASARALPQLRILARDAMPVAYRGLGFAGGLVDDGDGEVHPLRLLHATFASAEAEGGRVFEGTPVTAIDEHGDHARVRAIAGAVRAELVVVTTNAWTRRLLPALPVRPVRAQMLAARVDPPPAWAMPVYANRGADYWRRLADGTVLLGGQRAVGGATEETDDARPAPPVQPALDALLARIVGRAAVRVTDRWAGTMGFTPDGLPLVGRAPGHERVWMLGGFHGHGMGWGAGLAAALARAIDGDDVLDPVFSPARFSAAAREDGGARVSAGGGPR